MERQQSTPVRHTPNESALDAKRRIRGKWQHPHKSAHKSLPCVLPATCLKRLWCQLWAHVPISLGPNFDTNSVGFMPIFGSWVFPRVISYSSLRAKVHKKKGNRNDLIRNDLSQINGVEKDTGYYVLSMYQIREFPQCRCWALPLPQFRTLL